MRETYAFRRFVLAADSEPDAEPVTYAVQCAVCDASGPVAEVDKEAVGELGTVERERAARAAAAWVRQHRFSHGSI
ncbi:DUF7848 domain-containing protein [Streptomyces alkaliterrae]|uniref:DUF7848 domain-containing protein n=1 Tax=Streptomyces alkaliterrae TaxID=2213162 RepID=A0A5P0YQ69_9ACTN|nr:hypothetical protein [Streptomyces alkaliterrae]MBB1261436.1 hypothetical protein [Streptomyces alkaliterrae]MQS02405.1 hypothetical protein [Streptomyces alkaliterrae]